MTEPHNRDTSRFVADLPELGGPAELPAINRRIRRWIDGDSSASGEAIALLNLLARVNRALAPWSTLLARGGEPPTRVR